MPVLHWKMLSEPQRGDDRRTELVKGPNIASLPMLEPLPLRLETPVLLKVGDNISTDEIMPAGSRVLPLRSNIQKISEFVFEPIDPSYPTRALQTRERGGHCIVAGHNYGQGSSREHAAIAPRFLGLRVVLAKSFARIHWQNPINFGILPLTFVVADDYERIQVADELQVQQRAEQLRLDKTLAVRNLAHDAIIQTEHRLSSRHCDILQHGGLINWVKYRHGGKSK